MLAAAEKLAAAGASQQDVGLNSGAWTFSIGRDGTFSYVEPRGRSCRGTFAVNGHRLSLLEDTSVGDCDGQWELTFSSSRRPDDLDPDSGIRGDLRTPARAASSPTRSS